MRKASPLATVFLPECADSIESHPWLDNLFTLATYQVDQHEVDREISGEGDEKEQQESASSSSPPYTRTGLLRLYQGQLEDDGKVQCVQRYQEETAAILDVKWTLAAPRSASLSKGLLGVADASGHVSFHSLHSDSSGDHWKLSSLASMPFNSSKNLCLSLDWSDRKHHYPPSEAVNAAVNDASLVISQSDGSLAWLPSIDAALSEDDMALKRIMENEFAKYSTNDEDDGEEDEDDQGDQDDPASSIPTDWPAKPLGLETWHAHDHEAWIAAFDLFSHGRIIWSGGDDLALKGWDVRTPIKHRQRSSIFSNRREFQGGVTTMQSHWSREGLWAVGSYDSKLRIFESRAPARPVATVELPGGIWRLKWHPTDPSLLLAGCMHGGFAVIRAPWLSSSEESGTGDSSALDIVSSFEDHKSLAYGCDWERGSMNRVQEWVSRKSVPHTEGVKPTLVYSCSFYDKKLCSWLA